MNFRTFKQNKLVRDKIIKIMEDKGSKLYAYKLNDQDFLKQLKLKLLEEATEVSKAQTEQELLTELADVQEIIYTLLKFHNFTEKNLTAVREKKLEEKGGYQEKIFVTFAEHPKDSPQERYCLAESDKYPEVKNF
ncbi:nucleoside triphosphate pyrophosphohydrolase [Candidatus Dependentiae bacterium]|nr:nucleoside triphosphate pyrophosphohydrolase [Candidatus Dependentiae bacterium]